MVLDPVHNFPRHEERYTDLGMPGWAMSIAVRAGFGWIRVIFGPPNIVFSPFSKRKNRRTFKRGENQTYNVPFTGCAGSKTVMERKNEMGTCFGKINFNHYLFT